MQNPSNLEQDWPPELRQAKGRVSKDLQRLVMLRSVLQGIFEHETVRNAFDGTYRGNAFKLIETSLLRDAVSTLDRLFSKPGGKGPAANLSLLYVADVFNGTSAVEQSYKAYSRKWGAVSVATECQQTRNREATAREQKDWAAVEASIENVNNYADGPFFGLIRTFRSEWISHSVVSSRDRKTYRVSDDYELTFTDLFEAIDEGVSVGVKAYDAFFRVGLSVEDLGAYWRIFGDAFWAMSIGDSQLADEIEGKLYSDDDWLEG